MIHVAKNIMYRKRIIEDNISKGKNDSRKIKYHII